MKLFLKNIIFFTIKGALLFIMLFTIHSQWVRTHPFPELKKLQEALTTERPFLFFGDSVNRHYAKNDSDKRSLAEMLDTKLDQPVTGISYYAYHAEVYLEFIKYINRTAPNKKITILIPINLRSFSPEWDLRPGYQFLTEKYALNGYPYWHHFNFKQYELVSTSDFEMERILYNNTDIGDVIDIEKILNITEKDTTLKYGFIYHYMQAITLDNQKMKAFKEIASYNENTNLDIRLYFTPIDYMQAKKLGVKNFKVQISQNINTIQEELKAKSIEILNLSLLLDSTQFDYEKIPNEHLNQSGKEQLVEQLSSLFE